MARLKPGKPPKGGFPNRPVRNIRPRPTGNVPVKGTPLSQAPPSPQPLPLDPIYTGDIGNINQNYGDVLAGIGFDRTQLGQTYGFDAAGNLDPSNPYSVAANLQRRYQQGQAGTTNSMAARGQLYSGATQRNLDEGTFQYNRDYDTARRTAAGAYQDLTEREQRARFEHDRDVGIADNNRIGRLNPEDTVPQPTKIPRTGPLPGNVNKGTPIYKRRKKK